MGSPQWSQRLSPPFPFALRRWSPCPRHLLSLQPGESWMGVRLTSSSAHETRPPGGGQAPTHSPSSHSRHVRSGSGARRTLPGSLGAGRARGPAVSWRNRQPPGGGVGVPASLPVPLGPAALQRSHSRVQGPAAPQHLSARSRANAHGLQPSRKEACAGGGATSPRKPQGAND